MGKTMDKRDRGRVRTAEDLERKYDFAGMKKAIAQGGGMIDAGFITETEASSKYATITNLNYVSERCEAKSKPLTNLEIEEICK